MDGRPFFQLELFEFYRPHTRPLPADWRLCDIGYGMVSLLVDDGTGTFVPAADLAGGLVPNQVTGGSGLYFFDALPPGGRLLVSEPMGGGEAPHRFGDVYFALYCLAMKTGRVRSAARIGELMTEAGFVDVTSGSGARAYVTTAVMGRKPA